MCVVWVTVMHHDSPKTQPGVLTNASLGTTTTNFLLPTAHIQNTHKKHRNLFLTIKSAMTRHITNQPGNKHHNKKHTDNTTEKCSLKAINNLGIDE